MKPRKIGRTSREKATTDNVPALSAQERASRIAEHAAEIARLASAGLSEPAGGVEDQLISLDAAAKMLGGYTRRSLLRGKFPFLVRPGGPGGRRIMASKIGIARWLKRQRG